MTKKVSLVGTGNVGGTLAMQLAIESNNINNINLIDIHADYAKGKALDISHSLQCAKRSVQVDGGGDMSSLKDSDVIVVTAGFPRSPDMKSRTELLLKNAKVIKETANNIAKYAPNAFVICVTNPLDVMTWVMLTQSGLDKSKLIGMAGNLDSSRMAYLLSQKLKVSIEDIRCLILGGHGDEMLTSVKGINVAGIPLEEFIKNGDITRAEIDEIISRTRKGGSEVLKLMGASAYYSTATSVKKMIDSYLNNESKVMCCATYIKNMYDVDECVMGVPCVINKNGVDRIIEITTLEDDEKASFKASAKNIIESYKEIKF